jgi:hypothetical protein
MTAHGFFPQFPFQPDSTNTKQSKRKKRRQATKPEGPPQYLERSIMHKKNGEWIRVKE